MKKYIRICHCCGNTFETDAMAINCKSCCDKINTDYRFYYEYMSRLNWRMPKVIVYPTGYIRVVDETYETNDD